MKLLNLEYEKYKLSNGLEVILHQNNDLPLVAVNIWYKVGSANETKGKTGLAHLFEHMMFQGSKNAPKEMHFRLIQQAGGILNGSTTFDRTNYYEKLPSNQLELALWLESDRMGFLLPSLTLEKLENQKSVVLNERLEHYENQPYGLAWEKLLSNLFPQEHPYSWPTIGFSEDIKSFTLEDVYNFFKTYYSAANATLVVAGDFNINYCKDLIEKYFSDLDGNNISEQKFFPLAFLDKNIEVEYQDNVQLERIYLAWISDKALTEDDAVLDLIGELLSDSKNSRLYKKLVFEKEIAQDVSAAQFSSKHAGLFLIVATAKPNKNIAEIKREIINELEALLQSGVNERELLKGKNGIKANFINSFQKIDNIADHLNAYNFFLGEPNSFVFDLSRYESISNEDIKRCVYNYLSKPFVQLTIIPKRKIIS